MPRERPLGQRIRDDVLIPVGMFIIPIAAAYYVLHHIAGLRWPVALGVPVVVGVIVEWAVDFRGTLRRKRLLRWRREQRCTSCGYGLHGIDSDVCPECGTPRHTCPCCGFVGLMSPAYDRLVGRHLVRDLDPPYSNHLGKPCLDVCDCCGFEFGVDDEQGKTFEQHMEEWQANGCAWWDPDLRPEEWSIEQQLAKADRSRT